MNCNVGGVDRGIRFGIGTSALAFALFGKLSRKAQIAAFTIAGVELFTATTRFCPASQVFGINTCEPEERAKAELADAPSELVGSGI